MEQGCIDVCICFFNFFLQFNNKEQKRDSVEQKREKNKRFRSTCGGQWRGRTRRTPAWRSTSAGRWRGRPGWSHRSRRSTSSRGSDDLDLDGGGSQGSDLLLHAVSDTGVHGGAAGHDGVGVQVLPDVNIALHDGVVSGLVDAAGLHSEEGRLEESLGAAEPLVADGDDLAVGQLVGLLQGGGGGGGGHLLLEVQGDVAKLLLDVTDDLALGGGGEGVAALGQDLHQVVGQLAASQIQTDDGVGKSITLVDGDAVGDTVTGVHDNTGGTAGGVQGEHGLDSDVHGGHVEGLEHDLGHLLPVGLGVKGSLGQEDWVLLWGDTQLVVEGVVPDLLHVVPVGHDSVLNGVLQGEDTPLGLGLVTDIGVLLSHTDHDSLVAGTADDGGEDSSGSVISGEASLAHAGAIVNNEGSNVFVTHLGLFCVFLY